MINMSAFLGGLFAIGLLPGHALAGQICLLIDNLRTTAHCRALYLLLLHAMHHLACPLDGNFLLACRNILVNTSYKDPLFVKDAVGRLWLIVSAFFS
jgi:hypothetical protein